MLTRVDSPVSEALILICEKCGKKLSKDSDENPSRVLQGALKERIREEGLKGHVRAVVTTCMDVCPDGEIAIGITRPEEKEKGEFFTFRGRVEDAIEPVLEKARKL